MSTSQATYFPETIAGVRAFLRTFPTQTLKLRYILGLDTAQNAPKLAQSIVVNCIDTEHYERDRSKLTEIGINAFTSGDLRQYIGNPGPHGENLLKQIYYYHFRMLPNAHCVNKDFCPGNPERNRFGHTRFATHAEGKAMLEECFYWDVTAGKPQDGKCPTVVIGHALHNDTDGLARTIGFEPQAAETVVAVLDTQQMAREMGIYNSRGPQHEIGLRNLSAHFDIPYRDPHTAGNDAAYTTISAIYMALYGRAKLTFPKSVLQVVNDVETSSRQYSINRHGIPRYCTRCHAKNHFVSDCHKYIPPCEKCQAQRKPNAKGELHGVFWFTKGKMAHYPENCLWGSK
ncbi:uncharacterized protein N0V89_005277 [Didymosphaeria variabile]|uniref:Gfd2/YDR514C-like C-terminal domain-containing protein n=1 Tax=Didymosphaeria variabile TaxID=1932322 RepID=A0A9W8XKI0_9PLEO|nr:uncharacterized protein N0V89_005277 [Didymosphaeria variabile]KAJ4353547.1 hypothetical protein N0V89_005277 [Didymosphaeria variabile]